MACDCGEWLVEKAERLPLDRLVLLVKHGVATALDQQLRVHHAVNGTTSSQLQRIGHRQAIRVAWDRMMSSA